MQNAEVLGSEMMLIFFSDMYGCVMQDMKSLFGIMSSIVVSLLQMQFPFMNATKS